jgi:hypothetical protein
MRQMFLRIAEMHRPARAMAPRDHAMIGQLKTSGIEKGKASGGDEG